MSRYFSVDSELGCGREGGTLGSPRASMGLVGFVLVYLNIYLHI